MTEPCKRGLRTLHRIPAVKLLGVIVFDIVVPVRSTLRRMSGPPLKPARTSMWIVPRAASSDGGRRADAAALLRPGAPGRELTGESCRCRCVVPGMTLTVPADLLDLLDRPLYGALATIRPDGTAQVNPMWFEYDGAHCGSRTRAAAPSSATCSATRR